MHDEQWMRRALELSELAESNDEVPVGAVIVDNQSQLVLGEGANSMIGACDPTAHAEIVALRQAALARDNYRLIDSTLYVTLEPCAMCAGAIIQARVSRVVIAAKEPRAGAGGSVFNILDNPKLNHRCTVNFGLLAERSSEQLKSFFARRRQKKRSIIDML